MLAVVIGMAATFALGAELGGDLAGGPFSRRAHLPPPLAQTNEISRFITSTTGKKPDELVIVAGDHALLVTRPYYGFLPLRARYAHPEGHLAQRIRVLRAAVACPDPACTTRVLTASKFGPIDALVLAKTPAGLRINTQNDRFPRPQLVRIFFRPGSFSPATWARRDFGGFAVFVRR